LTLPMDDTSPDTPGARGEPDVSDLLQHLLDEIDIGVVSQRSIDELRDIRDRCQVVESGLSFGRRMAQGRLDIVMVEADRRVSGSTDALLPALPEVLARQTRSGGTPRPVRDTELPVFADDLTARLDRIVNPTELSHLGDLEADRLTEVIDGLQLFERLVSVKRHELHRIIDELQEEIVGRYRSGAASVDDLLR